MYAGRGVGGRGGGRLRAEGGGCLKGAVDVVGECELGVATITVFLYGIHPGSLSTLRFPYTVVCHCVAGYIFSDALLPMVR